MAIATRIDGRELKRLQQDLKEADPTLVTALRKRIKTAGRVGVEAIRAALDEPPPAGAPDPSGFREALKAGTSTVLSFAKKSGGVTIKTSSSKLPANEKDLFAAYNRKKGYRVPLFGNTERLFVQMGRPYFGAAILQKDTIEKMEAEMMLALDAAADALGGRIK